MPARREAVTPINWDNIPQYLRERARWTVWYVPEWLPGAEKPKKKLRLPSGEPMPEGYPITKNTRTFAEVQEACKKNPRFYPGFWIENSDGLIFLDYDGIPANTPAIPQIPSYTEASVYGYGYHILGWYKGTSPKMLDTKEVYMGGRWIVMTGCIVDNRKDVNDLSDFLKKYTKQDDGIKIIEPFTVPVTATARHPVLKQMVSSMVAKGYSYGAILAASQAENLSTNKPPKPSEQIEKEVISLYGWAKDKENSKEKEKLETEATAKKIDVVQTKPKKPNLDNPRLVVNLQNNFIEKYIAFIHGMSDSYPEYQHGAALMLLSTAVNKRAYLPLTIGTIYPNLWIFCLGQSTVSRKTTACTKLTEFIELQNQWMLLSYPGSPEALIEDLEGDDRVNSQENIGHGILCRDEAGGILSAMEKTYMADMRDLFCQLYDCRPFTRKLRTSQRKAKTTFNIRDTYLCMFFATTPDIFSVYTRLEDLTSGWLLRFLYYYPNYDHKLRDLSTMSDDDRERQKKIGQHLQAIITFFKNHEVEFQFSIAGLTFYNDWKNKHLTQMQREKQEDRGMFDRLSIYALKMAMLYTIGRDAMVDELKPESPKIVKLDINDECLRVACEHVDQYFYPVSKIVFETVGRNEEKNVLEKILGTIRRAGGRISRKNLMKRAHIKRKDLDDGLDTLFESTEVTKYLDEGGETCYTL